MSRLLSFALFALALVAGPAAHAQNAALLTSRDADRAEKLAAAARAEGQMTLYTSIAQKDIPPLTEAFQKKYGVRVNVWRASGDKVLQRVMEEAAARRFEVDAVHVSASELEALHREKLLQPVLSPHFADLVPGALPPHGEWVSTLLSVWVQAYNTRAVKKEDLPRTYRDLMDPKWKGRLGYEVENVEWFATVANEIGPDGVDWFRRLVAQNGLSVRKGHTLLNNLVVSGEVPLALTVYNYMPAQAKAKGAPIDWFALEPAVARSNGAAVMRNARRPAAAAAFIDFMLSDGQPILTSLDYVPVTTKLPSPIEGVRMKIIDPAVTLDQREKWEAPYNDIVVKQARN